MIPGIREIPQLHFEGKCSSEQAAAWLDEHMRGAAERAQSRFEVAALVLPGIASRGKGDPEVAAASAVTYADALIAKLAKRPIPTE